MANPMFEAANFRRDLPEGVALEALLALTFYDPQAARKTAETAGLPPEDIDTSGPPSTFWQQIVDLAASRGKLKDLLDVVASQPINPDLSAAIAAVRNVTSTGSLRATRMLLSGNRPFLGRMNLRAIVPEMQDWQSAASVLVVRGAPESGRTETQVLLADRSTDRQVLLDENLPLTSSLRRIWKAAGAAGDAPTLTDQALTTEPALLADFWTDVHEALEANDLRLWVLVDDLDKKPAREQIRTLAEMLAIRLRDVAFQRRLRLVLLGYPDPQLPTKVQPQLVREDVTELFDVSHVEAFLDDCLTAAGKRLEASALKQQASDLYTKAKVSTKQPLHGALHTLLASYAKDLL